MDYANLDLLFETSGDAFRVRVIHAPCGDAAAPQKFVIPFSEKDLRLLVLAMRGRNRSRRIDSQELEDARTIGSQLFSGVFKDEIRDVYRRSRDQCKAEGKGLRLRLNLTEAPALLNIPWELLYDESHKNFLSLSEVTPPVRYLSIEDPPGALKGALPLRILVMVSDPDDVAQLDVEGETEKLRQAVAPLLETGQVVLDVIPATLPALQDSLGEGEYHVFHFIGHGGFDKETRSGALLLEGKDGRAKEVSGQAIGTYLSNHHTLRFVVLNACEGGRSDSDDPFAGVAQTLVKQGVPAVLAMQFEISDDAAIFFAERLYHALVKGDPVDTALSEARLWVNSNLHPTVEWATPVLYMRSDNGTLFDLAPAPDAPPKVVPDLDGGSDPGPGTVGERYAPPRVPPPPPPPVRTGPTTHDTSPPMESLQRLSTDKRRRPGRVLALVVAAIVIVILLLVILLMRGSSEPPVFVSPLVSGSTIGSGQMLKSQNGAFVLVMQADGNLVEYPSLGVGQSQYSKWQSDTSGNSGATATMQPDGNFVVYGSNSKSLWSSQTGGNPGAQLQLNNDGSITIVSPSGSVVTTVATAPSTLSSTSSASGAPSTTSSNASAPQGNAGAGASTPITTPPPGVATLKLTPAGGGVNTVVSMQVTGFAANERIDLSFQGAEVGQFTTDSNGNLTHSYQIPDNFQGLDVSVTASADALYGSDSATANFQLTG